MSRNAGKGCPAVERMIISTVVWLKLVGLVCLILGVNTNCNMLQNFTRFILVKQSTKPTNTENKPDYCSKAGDTTELAL